MNNIKDDMNAIIKTILAIYSIYYLIYHHKKNKNYIKIKKQEIITFLYFLIITIWFLLNMKIGTNDLLNSIILAIPISIFYFRRTRNDIEKNLIGNIVFDKDKHTTYFEKLGRAEVYSIIFICTIVLIILIGIYIHLDLKWHTFVERFFEYGFGKPIFLGIIFGAVLGQLGKLLYIINLENKLGAPLIEKLKGL